MKSFWLFFLEKKSFTYLLVVALFAASLFSVISIPKESAPEVVIPVGIVTTVLRGGSAEDVEKLITTKIEQEIANVQNIDKITSTSREGLSVISAQFLASADVDESIDNLKEAIDKAKADLPGDAEDPVVSKINFADQPILIASISQDTTGEELNKLADTVKEELENVKGVSKVEVSGVRKKEIQVVLKQSEMVKYGVSQSDVVRALQSSNASFPVGRIAIDDIEYPIKFSGSLGEAEEISNVSFMTSSGALVYLRDIAFVVDGAEDTKNISRISVGGTPSQNALTLFVYKKSGGDVTKITDSVKEKIDTLKKDVLYGAEVVVTIDAGKDVKKDLTSLSSSGLQTVVLVMLILVISVGWRESVVTGLSIFLSFLLAFIGLYVSGNTINFLSLFSLILATGILVDSGIVVSESMNARMKQGEDAMSAAKNTIEEFAWPLISGTMTTVAVFAPLLFLSGVTGQFIKSIPFTLVFVLLSSIFVALALVPLFGSRVFKKEEETVWSKKRDSYFDALSTGYKNILKVILLSKEKQKKIFLSITALFITIFVILFSGLIKVELFPQEDINFVVVSIEHKEGAVLKDTDLITRQVEEILYDNQYAESFVTTVGASSGLVDNNGAQSNKKMANITVMLKEKRDFTSTEILEKLRSDLLVIKGAEIKVSQINNGPPGGKPIVIKFLGEDLDKLSLSASKAEDLLGGIEGARDIETSLKNDGTQIEVRVDPFKATQAGVSPLEVAQILRTAISGNNATEIKRQKEDIDVLVRFDLNQNFVNPEDAGSTTVDSIKNLRVATRTGDIILGSIIDITLAQGRSAISRDSQKRVVSVSAGLVEGFTAVEVTKAFKDKENTLALDESVTITYGGETEDIDNTFRDMLIALVSGLLLMLAILVVEFNSFRYSFYLLATVPLGLIGILWGLFLSGQALSFTSMLGIISMAGIVINNGIILLDSMLIKISKNRNFEEKDYVLTIILESCAARLRPVLLTTITTVIGMIPLSMVSALWSPFAITIISGLTFSTVLTLIIIPIFFYKRFQKDIAQGKL